MAHRFFGDFFANRNNRIDSYNFLEAFLAEQHFDWSTVPNTDSAVKNLQAAFKKMDNEEFAFLVCHSGYIPEIYSADSSQETLYTKFIEALVMEWGVRLGFDKSVLPKMKSSTEDVTFLDDTNVIVCDAKSFRLGRSQGAPNVKDVLKHSDIEKWLSKYNKHNKIGGLVTFPSQHDWKKGSDFYQYTSDKNLPTLCLNYEHMAFLLLTGFKKEHLINLFEAYGDVFPNKLPKSGNNRDQYYEAIEKYLFSDIKGKWIAFRDIAQNITSECVFNTVNRLNAFLKEEKEAIEKKYMETTDIELLRKVAIESEFNHKTDNLQRQTANIRKFRNVSNGFLK